MKVSFSSDLLSSSGMMRCASFYTSFDTPLIERIDVPDCALGRKHRMLVKALPICRLPPASASQPGWCSMDDFLRRPGEARATPGTPSASTWAGVLPKAKASACAQTLAINMS